MEETDNKETDSINVKLYNLGTVNKNQVVISKGNGFNSVALYFSYQTLVAVDSTVSENIWSKTTGKLLNELCPNKKARVSHAEVLKEAQKRLQAVLKGVSE